MVLILREAIQRVGSNEVWSLGFRHDTADWPKFILGVVAGRGFLVTMMIRIQAQKRVQ